MYSSTDASSRLVTMLTEQKTSILFFSLFVAGRCKQRVNMLISECFWQLLMRPLQDGMKCNDCKNCAKYSFKLDCHWQLWNNWIWSPSYSVGHVCEKHFEKRFFFFPFLSSKSFFPVVAFLPVSSSLPSPQQHFRTRVILSQQHLMYIWPLMLSLHVPEPKAQLKPSRHPSLSLRGPRRFAFCEALLCTSSHFFPSHLCPGAPPAVCTSPLSLPSYYTIVTGHKTGLLHALCLAWAQLALLFYTVSFLQR